MYDGCYNFRQNVSGLQTNHLVSNGILQKNIYAELPDFQRSDIQRMLRKLESENVITRIKKSGSYELHLNCHE